MGALSLPLLVAMLPGVPLSVMKGALIILTPWLAGYLAGQFGFFQAQKTVEPSRISSLMGLKIPLLACFVLLQGQTLGAGRWLAVVIVTVAAFCLNWSGGGRLSVRGLLWLSLTPIGYAACDMMETGVVQNLAGQEGWSMFGAALTTIFFFYTVLGLICGAAFIRRRRFEWRIARDSLPFCASWYASQLALFFCFGTLGAVFGNVIQASRGVFSVCIGVSLIALGWRYPEPPIGRLAWVRRAFAAVLMAAGIALYALKG